MSADAMTAHRMIAERDRVITEQALEIDGLKKERDLLQRYIDDAKRACGDDRVSGEPLVDVIVRLTRERNGLREMMTSEQLEEWRHKP